MRFEGDGRAVDEVERRMRVSDDVLRFLTVRKEQEEKVSAKRKAYYEKKRLSLEKKKKRSVDAHGPRDHRDRRDYRDRPRTDSGGVRK